MGRKYDRNNEVFKDDRPNVVAIDISSNEDLAAICFDNNNIGTFDLGKAIPSTTEAIETGKLQKLDKKVVIEYIHGGFHGGAVTCMDVCLHRPLIVTCCKTDSTIRIWNYVNFKCELARSFYVKKESNVGDLNPVLSVAFHPTGYYLAAGFIDKLRFFHIMHSKLRDYKEVSLIKCTCLKFSNGGHMIAAAAPRTKSTHYMLNIYNAYTTEYIAQLKGHTNTVTEIVWGKQDDRILSCGLDGSIYEWRFDESNTRKDFMSNNCKLTSIAQTNQMMISAGVEGGKNIIREIRGNEYTKVHQMGPTRVVVLNSFLSLYNFPSIIAGTENGFIQVQKP